MKSWWSCSGSQLWLALSLSVYLSASIIVPALAQVKSKSNIDLPTSSNVKGGLHLRNSPRIRQLSEVEPPITNAQQLLVQSPTPQTTPAPTIQITGVKANPTQKGVEVILETTQENQLQVANRSAGNNFIVDITGGQLRLSNGDAFRFRSEKPLAGITEITVTNVDANTVRVTVVGVAALPTVELFDDNVGLIFAVASTATATQPPQTPPAEEKPASETPQEKPAAQQDEPIELVVTGEQDGYQAPNATTGTRLDIPVLDTPGSIGVITRELIEDIAPKRGEDLIPFVPGVEEREEQISREEIFPNLQFVGLALGDKLT